MFTKMFPSVAVFVALSVGAVAYAENASDKAPRSLPNMLAVLPDTLPLNLDEIVTLEPTAIVARLSPKVIPSVHITTSSDVYVWECSASRPLENDRVQTVKDCQMVKR